MALHHYCIDKEKHFFKGLQSKTIIAPDITNLDRQLDDFLKAPANGDTAVFEVLTSEFKGNLYMVIIYAKFTKRREENNTEQRLRIRPQISQANKVDVNEENYNRQ